MNGTINVKSPYNINKWQMGFNSAFKGLIYPTIPHKSTGRKRPEKMDILEKYGENKKGI
jgi:hypothetical protein